MGPTGNKIFFELPNIDQSTPNSQTIKMYYQNTSGLKSKLKQFFLSSFSTDFNIFVITETWFNTSILNNNIASSKYSIFRLDRNSENSKYSNGGGVMIGVESTANPEQIETPNDIEIICVLLTLHGKKIFVSASYIPPLASKDIYDKHATCIQSIIQQFDENVLCFVCGDFNIPNIKWTPDCYENPQVLIPLNSNHKEEDFLDILSSLSLYQLNDCKNANDNILDLIYSNELSSCILKPVETSDLLCANTSSHHTALMLEYNLEVISKYKSGNYTEVLDYKKGDYTKLDSLIQNTDWKSLFEAKDIEICTKIFYDCLADFISLCIPVRRKYHSNDPPWFNRDIKSTKNRLNKIRKKSSFKESTVLRQQYIQLKSELDSKIQVSYRNYLDEVALSFQTNPEFFWTFVKNKSKTNGIPNRMSYNGNSSDSETTICNYFKDFFQSVHSCKSNSVENYLFDPKRCLNGNINMSTFEQMSIEKELYNLDNNKSSGPDGISPFLLKKCASSISCPLSLLFNLSLSTETLPECWKESYIIPLHKNKSRNKVEHYRGIAKLSAIPKVMEKMICDCVSYHWSSIICDSQHGFMKKRSTASNLLNFTTSTIRNFTYGYQTDCIYTDFSKAFDKVDHDLLVVKLLKIGFSPWFINWIKSYVSNRIQYVLLNETKSSPINVTSGVPQGSHLGPLLFLVFIDDIYDVIKNSKILLYADDCKIYKTIQNAKDCEKLQYDIDNIAKWCQLNNMFLNLDKCQVMSFFRTKRPIICNYYLCSSTLHRITEFNDLGVKMDRKLSFVSHYNYLISTCNLKLGIIFRFGHEFNSISVLQSLFCSLVRQKLEYCCMIWNPQFVTHRSRLELIQKKFLRRILQHFPWENPIRLPPYEDRLNLLKLSTLHKRRDVLSIMFILKILNGEIFSPYILSIIKINIPSFHLRNYKLLCYDIRITYTYLKFEPINVMINLFNKYYSCIDFNVSLYSIKCKLLQHL